MTEAPSNAEWEKILAKVGYDQKVEKPKAQEFPDADIPEIDLDFSTDELGQYVETIDIVTAYQKWCGKSEINTSRGQRESIKVSCPNPAHPDRDPSAWLNLDKGEGGLWYCGGCGFGGDKFDIAAWHFNYSVPEYKYDESFRELCAEMAASMGWEPADEVERVKFYEELSDIVGPASVPSPEPADPRPRGAGPYRPPDGSSASPSAGSGEGTVTELKIVSSEEEPEPAGGSWFDKGEPLAWRDIFDPNGFRAAYIDECAPTRIIPHEFFAAGADSLLGLAMSHKVYVRTSANVYGNFFQSLVGPTGSGKSLSMIPANKLVEDVLPWAKTTGKGVKILHSPASGEALIDMMHHEGVDPATSQPVEMPVTGYVYIDELSQLIIKAQRKGSTLQPVLIEMFGATDGRINTKSMSGGIYSCYRPFLTMVTGTQPMAMHNLLDDSMLVNGFLNRFMFYVATQPPVPKNYDDTQDNPFVLPLAKERLEAVRDWAAGRSGPLLWEDDARRAYMEVFYTESWDKGNFDDTPVLARTRLIFLKLILLCAGDVCSDVITLDHVERAYDQLQYMKRSLLYVARHVTVTQYDEIMEQIVEIFGRYGAKGMKKGEIRKRLPSKFYDMFEKTLEVMVDMRMVSAERVNPGAKGGRPSVLYKMG